MKSTTLLQQQHRRVESLVSAIRSAAAARTAPMPVTSPGAKDVRELAEELVTAVTAHMMIEEEMFYPEARGVRPDVLRNYEEHEIELMEMERMLATPEDDENFMARLDVMEDMLSSHVAREEGDLFPAVDQAIPATQNEALGQQMEARFDELVKLGRAGAMAQRKQWMEGLPAMPGAPEATTPPSSAH